MRVQTQFKHRPTGTHSPEYEKEDRTMRQSGVGILPPESFSSEEGSSQTAGGIKWAFVK